jgi:hypothetical protein
MATTVANDTHSRQVESLAGPPSTDATPTSSVTNQELWLLSLYTLPTLFSAYKYGRRHAVMTALASALLVVLVIYFRPPIMYRRVLAIGEEKWFDIGLWAGIMLVIAYAMGTLYERMQSNLRELRASYRGILLILQHIVANDKYSQNHSYRVSVCATKIAERMELSSERVEDIRAAALLQDVDKLGISREILYKSANFTADEFHKFQRAMAKGKAARPPVGRSLQRVIPHPVGVCGVERRESRPLPQRAPGIAHPGGSRYL